jgi:hypothetical protein
LVAILSIVSAIKSQAPPVWLKALLFGSLSLGVLFCGLGAATSMMALSREVGRGFSASTASTAVVLANLKANAKVTWVIRLIPFDDEKQPELGISRLTYFGRSDQRFTFVGDYYELKGFTASDAVKRLGLSMEAATRVSAIIFPLNGRQLYPANARGVLQVVRKIESTRDRATENYAAFDVENNLRPDEIEDLKKIDHHSYWNWNNYSGYYRTYCVLAQKYRCEKTIAFTAKSAMGDLNRDWHPIGLALAVPTDSDPCKKPKDVCDIDDWKELEPLTSNIGARIFYLENEEISKLSGRVLIDFDKPDIQVIPDLGTMR